MDELFEAGIDITGMNLSETGFLDFMGYCGCGKRPQEYVPQEGNSCEVDLGPSDSPDFYRSLRD